MPVYSNSKMDSVYCGDTLLAYEGEDCEVRIDGEEIVVSYQDDQEIVVYKGKENSQGHYILESPERQGEATLHRFPEG